MNSDAQRARLLEQGWWHRLPLLLFRPHEVFAELRDDSQESADARQEPLAALVFVAGIWLFLATATAGRLYDDFAYRGDALLIAVQAIVAGALVGLQNYWLGGAAVYAGTRGMGATTGYRLARHVVGLAMTPFVLAFFTVFPIQLIVFGGDLFRTGGSDEGTAGDVFRGITAGFAVWAVAIAVIGVRTVQAWSWLRAAAALGIAAILIGLLGLLAVLL